MRYGRPSQPPFTGLRRARLGGQDPRRVHPIYYHNYGFGHLAAQIRRCIEKNAVVGPFYGCEVAGRYLQEAVFGPGARDDWRTAVLRATGEELNPRYFVESLR